jgi:hypothetical protein
MRKILLFSGFIILIFSVSHAQNLSLGWINGHINNGDTIEYIADTGYYVTTYSYVDCTNHGASTSNVKVRKFDLDTVAGTENAFCWDICYQPPIHVSNGFIPMIKDSLYSNFIGDYKPRGHCGISYVMYTFFNVADANDTISVVVKYNGSCSSGIEVNSQKVEFSNAFPNPADDQVSFTYSRPASSIEDCRLIIRDMVGNIVFDLPLTVKSGTLKVNTNDLNSGLYFYSLMVGDQFRFTKKLIIRH